MCEQKPGMGISQWIRHGVAILVLLVVVGNIRVVDGVTACPMNSEPFYVRYGDDTMKVWIFPNKENNDYDGGLIGSLRFIKMRGKDKYLVSRWDNRPFIIRMVSFAMVFAKNVKIDIYDPDSRKMIMDVAKFSPKVKSSWFQVILQPPSFVNIWTTRIVLRFVRTRADGNWWNFKDLFMCGCVPNDDYIYGADYDFY